MSADLETYYSNCAEAIGYDFDNKSRRTEFTAARFAFTVVCLKRGLHSRESIASVLNIDRTNTYHAEKNHENNYVSIWTLFGKLYHSYYHIFNELHKGHFILAEQIRNRALIGVL